jgi:hypothetical protein
MTIVDRLKQKYVLRLDELIQLGCEMPMKQHSQVSSTNYITNETKHRQFSLADWSSFIEWRTSCIAVLDLVVPKNSLLRKTVDAFDTLSNEPTKVKFAVAFLRSIKTELLDGSLDALILQIEAEVLADYLEQATSILSNAKRELSHVPAAVIAGASLEKSLRTLCGTLAPPEPIVNEKGGYILMNALIDALKKRNVYNELQAKQLRAWTDIRNSAAHGNFDDFNRQQVEQMLVGISSFVAQYVR